MLADPSSHMMVPTPLNGLMGTEVAFRTFCPLKCVINMMSCTPATLPARGMYHTYIYVHIYMYTCVQRCSWHQHAGGSPPPDQQLLLADCGTVSLVQCVFNQPYLSICEQRQLSLHLFQIVGLVWFGLFCCFLSTFAFINVTESGNLAAPV